METTTVLTGKRKCWGFPLISNTRLWEERFDLTTEWKFKQSNLHPIFLWKCEYQGMTKWQVMALLRNSLFFEEQDYLKALQSGSLECETSLRPFPVVEGFFDSWQEASWSGHQPKSNLYGWSRV